MDSPLHVTLYDRTFRRTAWLDDLDRLKVNPRHLLIPTVDFDVPMDYRFLADITEPGARITVVNEEDGDQIFSGPIRPWTGSGPTSQGVLTFTAEDDARIVWNLIGYPTPGSPTETQPNKVDARAGDAETVFKGYVSANLARWGRPITVAPNLNRGGQISTDIRMLPLTDKLLPLLETANIGFQVRQVRAGLVVDVYEQRLFPLNLTEGGGSVQDYTVSFTPHTATRAVIGGPNAGTSREFKSYVDTAREALYGDVIEIFVDGGDEVNTDKLIAKGKAAVDDAGPKYGVNITLDDTSIYRYGNEGIRVGDKVPVELGLGLPPITDVVREPELTFTREDGYKATFSIGDVDGGSADAVIADTLTALVRGYREQRVAGITETSPVLDGGTF